LAGAQVAATDILYLIDIVAIVVEKIGYQKMEERCVEFESYCLNHKCILSLVTDAPYR
jgi:hypothetical protein